MLTITHGFNKMPQDIELLKQRFKTNRIKVLRISAIVTGSSIILGTPVDTGKARANWQTSLNSPILNAIDKMDASGAEAIRDIGGVTAQFGGTDSSIWISNNLPYINRLNNGWSKKADPGYVERVIEGAKVHFEDDYLIKDNPDA